MFKMLIDFLIANTTLFILYSYRFNSIEKKRSIYYRVVILNSYK